MIRAVVAVLCVATIVAADNLALRGAEKCQGVCQDVNLKGCNAGNYVAGRCPGKKNIQCCVPTPKPAASTGNDGVGAKCKTGPGVCQLTSTQCAGTFVSGLCPGKGNVQCCQPKPERPITRPSTPTPTPVQPQPQPQTPTPAPSTNGKWPVTFSSLWQKYPHGEAADVKRRIGGSINADYITNTCVVRVTRAMVASGMNIDGGFKLANGKNILLVKGGDQKGLAIRVAEFKQYVAKKIGAPDIKVVNAGDGTAQIPAQFMGKKGMIMFDVRVWNDATGHFDLWDGNACAHNCYWDKAKEVWLWEIA